MTTHLDMKRALLKSVGGIDPGIKLPWDMIALNAMDELVDEQYLIKITDPDGVYNYKLTEMGKTLLDGGL